jgi:predicted nucleic acid-binding protein
MSTYVIGPDVADRLAAERVAVSEAHELLAPALIRSQLVTRLFQAARRGELTRAEARQRLDHTRALRLRLLGDRVLQNVSWDVAAELDWADTYTAEYVALTRLHADAFVTLDDRLSREVSPLVDVAPYDVLLG